MIVEVVAIAVFESVTETLKVDVPATDGVPLITPVEDEIESPVGSEPVVTLNTLCPEPPVLVKVSEKERFRVNSIFVDLGLIVRISEIANDLVTVLARLKVLFPT